MSDKKLTDLEIVKALECCARPLPHCYCDECPAGANGGCAIKTENIIDLINRLQAENKRLSTLAELGNTRTYDYRVMRDRALKAEAENERLKPFEDKIAGFNSHIRVEDMLVFASSLEEWLEFCDNLKAEAYKEVAEMIDKTTWYHINKNGELVVGANSETNIPLYKAEDIHNILKELIGE